MTRRGGKKKSGGSSGDSLGAEPSTTSTVAAAPAPPPPRGGASGYTLRAQPAPTDAYSPPVPTTPARAPAPQRTARPDTGDPASPDGSSSTGRFSGGSSSISTPNKESSVSPPNPWKDHRNRIIMEHGTQGQVIDMTADTPTPAAQDDRDVFARAAHRFNYEPSSDETKVSDGSDDASHYYEPSGDAALAGGVPPTITTPAPIMVQGASKPPTKRPWSPPPTTDPPSSTSAGSASFRPEAIIEAEAELRSEIARGSKLLSASAPAFHPPPRSSSSDDATKPRSLTGDAVADAVASRLRHLEEREAALADRERALAQRMHYWDSNFSALETRISSSHSELESRLSSVTSMVSDDALTARISRAVTDALSTHTLAWDLAQKDLADAIATATNLLAQENLTQRISEAVSTAVSSLSEQHLTEFTSLLNQHRRNTATSITNYGVKVEESMAATANKYIALIKRAGTHKSSAPPSDSATVTTGLSTRSGDPDGRKDTPVRQRPSYETDTVTHVDPRGYPTTVHTSAAATSTAASSSTIPTSNVAPQKDLPSSTTGVTTGASSVTDLSQHHVPPKQHPWIRDSTNAVSAPVTAAPALHPSQVTWATSSALERPALYHEGRYGIDRSVR